MAPTVSCKSDSEHLFGFDPTNKKDFPCKPSAIDNAQEVAMFGVFHISAQLQLLTALQLL